MSDFDLAIIGAVRQTQDVQKAVMARLLGSIEQAGQAQAPVRRVDTVQISAPAQALANAGR